MKKPSNLAAERWAEEMLQEYQKTEQYKLEKQQMEEEFKNFLVYGTPTTWFDDDTLYEMKTEFLDADTIIERYSLTDKEIEDLRNLHKRKV